MKKEFISKRFRNKIIKPKTRNKAYTHKTLIEECNNNITNNNQSISSIDKHPKNILHIPGYYYDSELNRYFPEKNTMTCTFEQYLKEKNEKILNFKQKQECERVKFRKIEKISIFNYVRNFKISNEFNSSKIILPNKNSNSNEFQQFKLTHYSIKDGLNCKYSSFEYNNGTYISTLQSDNRLKIEKINLSDSSDRKIFNMNLEYNQKFDNIIYLKDYILFVCGFKVFSIKFSSLMKELLSHEFNFKINEIYFENFRDNNPKLCNLPSSYIWPVIREYNNHSYIFLFSKKLYIVHFEHKSSLKEISVRNLSLDFNECFRKRNFEMINIETERSFDKNTYTEVFYHKNNQKFIMCESLGNIHIYDKNFKIIQIISLETSNPYSIINLTEFNNNFLVLGSNSNLEYIYYNNTLKKFFKEILLESTNQSYFKTTSYSLLDNENKKYYIFINEKEELVFFNIRDQKQEKNIKMIDDLSIKTNISVLSNTLNNKILKVFH